MSAEFNTLIASCDYSAAWCAAVTDYVSEREYLQRTPVELHELPKGFNLFWHRHVLRRSRTRPERYPGYGRWSNSEIFQWLQNLDLPGRQAPFRWLDHGGSTVVGGVPALVGEPYLSGRSEDDAVTALVGLFGCPATFHPEAAWNTGCVRFAVWFTFPRAG